MKNKEPSQNIQELVQKAIFDNIHQKGFFLEEEAPDCNGQLQGLFGYNAVTITAQRILNGTYKQPRRYAKSVLVLDFWFLRIL